MDKKGLFDDLQQFMSAPPADDSWTSLEINYQKGVTVMK